MKRFLELYSGSATVTTTSRLTARWPTALGLILAGACAVVIVGGDVEKDFVPGIATMMGIYLAAYAIGRPASAWLAFAVLFTVAALMGVLGVEAAVVMTAILVPLWLWVLARGLAGDRPWFTLETLGLLFFGALTLAAFLADARLAGILAGTGWFTHGLWDAYHFAKDRIVVRSWSELCAVVDIPVGALLIAVSAS